MNDGAPRFSNPEVTGAGGQTSLRDNLRVLDRRKWIVLLCILVVPVVAVALSTTESPEYQGSAEVLLADLNLATTLTGVPSSSVAVQPDRVAATQADLARVPTVAQQALQLAGVHGMTAAEFLKSSSVTAKTNADLLEFTVDNGNEQRAARLATAYANAYTNYRRELDNSALEQARRVVETRLAQLKTGPKDPGLVASLEASDQKLRTMEALQSSNASVVRTADAAQKIRPRPTRNGMLGLGLGIVLGIGLAFVAEGLDTRVRSVDEVADRLGLPLLSRLPGAPRGRGAFLPMLYDPSGDDAEAYRVLRTNVDLVNLQARAQAIMVTSAIEAEGKSRTASNLAIALARSGRHVALVDLDLRKPSLGEVFRFRGGPGLIEVAIGSASLDEALVSVPLGVVPDYLGSEKPTTTFGKNGHTKTGVLEVLPVRQLPPNPGEFVGTESLGRILNELRSRADVLVIDSPALLRAGDGIVLSSKVDAVIVIVSVNVVRRHVLKELRRVLDALPAAKLGFAATGLDDDLSYGGYGPHERPSKGNAQYLKKRDARAATAKDRP